MKKFLIILISKLFLFSNYALSNEILLECIWEEQNDTFFDSPAKAEDSDEIDYTYYSLSPDLKIMQVKGTRTKAKGECLIGKCESVELYNRDMPFISEDYEYLKIGEEEKNYITLNKQTGGVVWYSYYWEEIGSTNTFKQIDNWGYYSCKATKELPF